MPPTPLIMLLERVPAELLWAIRDGEYMSKIHKKISVTYAHAVKVFRKLEDMGLIKKYRKGRIVKVFLTKKGQEVRDLLRQINETFINL